MTEPDKDPAPPATDSSAEVPATRTEVATTTADPELVADEVRPELPAKKSKKGRRKKRAAAESELSGPRSELDGEGRDRPAFLLNFPRDPELEPLIAAFEAGNYASVREFAPKLAERSDRADVKAAAAELRKRIDPDPLVKFLVAVAVLLFVAVLALVYRSHH